jgi:acetolactate synthase regulatory subunit
MTSALLPLTFSVDKDTALDSLEAVLAIARRGGLSLAALQVTSVAAGKLIAIELLAGERDLLDLFSARLHNLVDVYDIATGPIVLEYE